MKKLTVLAALIAALLAISYLFKLQVVYVLLIAMMCIIIYYYIDLYFNKEHDEKFIEQKLALANKELIKTPNLIILIVRDNKVIWANDLTYSEFPQLRTNRDISTIHLNQIKDNRFTFNNKIYEVTDRDGLYFIEDITKTEREINYLRNKETNIAILYIDNYSYLKEQLSRENFGRVVEDLRIDIIRFFDKHNIFYQEFDGQKYQLLIPENELIVLIENKFNDLFEIFKKYQTSDYTFSYSMGVALNQPNIRSTGYRALEALDLAKSRGGAQTVIFDGDKRIIFGGGQSVLQGSTLTKARLMFQTLINIARTKQKIYVMGHRHADSDSIASMALVMSLLKERCEAQIIGVIEKEKEKIIRDVLENDDVYEITSTPEVSNESKNVLIVIDTQSQSYVSNPELLSQISDVIVIDHHQTPDDFIINPVTKWIEPSISSVVEMIMQMYLVSQTKLENRALATYALYGILVDTNLFTYRVSPLTLDIVKNLVNNGGDLIRAKQLTFNGLEEFKELSRITQNVEIKGKYSYLYLEGESDHILLSKLADNILEIKSIIASIVVSKCDNKYYVKMRSMGDVNTKNFLEEFGGGGHASQAAACLDEAMFTKLLAKINQ